MNLHDDVRGLFVEGRVDEALELALWSAVQILKPVAVKKGLSFDGLLDEFTRHDDKETGEAWFKRALANDETKDWFALAFAKDVAEGDKSPHRRKAAELLRLCIEARADRGGSDFHQPEIMTLLVSLHESSNKGSHSGGSPRQPRRKHPEMYEAMKNAFEDGLSWKELLASMQGSEIVDKKVTGTHLWYHLGGGRTRMPLELFRSYITGVKKGRSR